MAASGMPRLGCEVGGAPANDATESVIPPAGSGLRLDLNLPAYRLDVFGPDSAGISYRVGIGAVEYPTTGGLYRVWRIVWSPAWLPPPSDWARDEMPAPPGPSNPMGRVKLDFGGMNFLHGSPDSASLGRARSHGCIRLANSDAVALARMVQRVGSDEPAPGDEELVVWDSTTTRSVLLARPVPLLIRYDLAEVDRERITLYPDVYHLAGDTVSSVVFSALLAAGYPEAALDSVRIGRLADQAQQVPTTVPIADLLARPQ